MDISKQKEMKKKRPNQSTWYDWLIYYIPVPIRKTVVGVNIRNFLDSEKKMKQLKNNWRH